METKESWEQKSHAYQKIAELIHDVNFVMLAYSRRGTSIHSCPMTIIGKGFEGALRFIVNKDSDLVRNIQTHSSINISFHKEGLFVSLGGHGYIEEDPSFLRENWSAAFDRWFPLGVSDASAMVLRFVVEEAESWDTKAEKVERILGVPHSSGKRSEPPRGYTGFSLS